MCVPFCSVLLNTLEPTMHDIQRLFTSITILFEVNAMRFSNPYNSPLISQNLLFTYLSAHKNMHKNGTHHFLLMGRHRNLSLILKTGTTHKTVDNKKYSNYYLSHQSCSRNSGQRNIHVCNLLYI